MKNLINSLEEFQRQIQEEALMKAKVERQTAEVILQREEIHRDMMIAAAASQRIDLGINVKPKGES